MKTFLAAIAISTICWAAALPARTPASPDLRGGWETERYFLVGGMEHPLKGRIFFTGKEWTVLFFVMGSDADPKRGSAEGGTYTLAGDRLVFVHRYHLSFGEPMAGLKESPMRMSVQENAEAPNEHCTVELRGEILTIHFPSGNRMRFRRSSSF
jgi:hypothetical protein